MGAGKGFERRMPVVPDSVQHLPSSCDATVERKKVAEICGKEVGVCFRWVPGSALPGQKLWEKVHSEAVEVWMDLSLFADDTTAVGDEDQLEEGVETIKKVMSQYEEKNNDDKEESL